MFELRRAVVLEVTGETPELFELLVAIDEKAEPAIAYRALLSDTPRTGDELLVNTTAVDLGLGTGGYHFVVANFSRPEKSRRSGGHIMKLRYTPFQLAVEAAEEQGAPHRERLLDFESLRGTPVVCATLHSMLAPIVAGVRSVAGHLPLRIAYVMTDGGALPASFSRVLYELRSRGLLDATVTAGHAFGGDYEAVNLYSALAVARAVAEADVIVVAMGPGKVGTGTRYGCSELEQAVSLNAVASLGGYPIAVPRVNLSDPSYRHYGVSPHTLTVLSELTLAPSVVATPPMDDTVSVIVTRTLKPALARRGHSSIDVETSEAIDLLRSWPVEAITMGRALDDDPYFFAFAAAAGVHAADQAIEQGVPAALAAADVR